MSLLTPPSTAHRRAKDKENTREIDSNSRVIWSETNKIHILQVLGPASTSFKVTTVASASKLPPSKSILKKYADLKPWPQEKQREVTPEPEDPMVNPDYLVYPVSTIVDATEVTELRVLVEAYSVLTARLRSAVTGVTETDESWPLFRPLREHTEKFTEAVVRDLGRALEDPAVVGREQEQAVRVLLPSPTNTPVKKKKRDGLSAEQVKYARDLCTTSHAVIRLLSLVFTLPAIMNVFSDKQLRRMFTAVLAIPLADDLPTPNARKTWALAIWLIQTQRLSAPVLTPAADRIALALCRGIDGELGKEGKKGSTSDGLKAIHDLSVHLPAVFIPAFTHSLLPSVLASLLAPTVTLRTIAAHALGGFVLGATSVPNAPIHSEISNIVLKYITTLPPPRDVSSSPTKSTTSPTKVSSSPITPSLGSTPQTPTKLQDPSIIRTLRTTLTASDPIHVAHGPVWATCVLSALLVLLGPAAMRVPHLRVLVQLGLQHKNRNVRALTTVMWRCIVWVYVRPRLITAADEDGEDEMDEREAEREVKVRDEWWKVVASVVENETGVCAIAATIGSGNVGVPVYEPHQWVDRRLSMEEREEQPLRRALEVLITMAGKDAPTRMSMVDTMKALLGMPPQAAMENEAEERTLIPKALFSALPGLLSTEYAALKTIVNSAFDETPKAEDVRALTKAEIGKPWVWDGVVRAWRAAVGAGKGEDATRERKILLNVWEGMVSIAFGTVTDPDDEDADRDIDSDYTPVPRDAEVLRGFTHRLVEVIITHVLEDPDLNLQPSSSSSNGPLQRTGSKGLDIPGFSSSPKSMTAKLGLARDMWSVICRILPHMMLGSAAEHLAQCLMKNTEDFTTFGNSTGLSVEEDEDEKEMNEAWAELCVEVLSICGIELVRAFWDGEKGKGAAGCRGADRALIWRIFAKGWVEQSTDAGWDGAVCGLAVPFRGRETWILTSEDAATWQSLLEFAVTASLDYGDDSNAVLGAVARLVEDDEEAGYMSVQMRLVEFVLNYLGDSASRGDLRELPEAMLEFVATMMSAAYPPPKDQTTYTWTVRAMTAFVDQCPREILSSLGETLAGALAIWIADAEDKWDNGVIEYDIVPLYQTILCTIQGRASIHLLSTFGAALLAPLAHETRSEIRGPAVEAFREFWDTTYADVDVPSGGWPDDIAACLAAVYGAPVKEKGALIAGLEAAFTSRPTTPAPFTPSTSVAMPSTPCSSSSSLCYDHTVLNTPSTPPRPSKSTRSFTQLHVRSPESLMHTSRLSALSRPPTPRTSRYSPVKRRKLANGNKENLSPINDRVIPSVVDRILASSPPINPRKRQFEQDPYTADSSEDERCAVENLVMPSPDAIYVAPRAPSTASSKKRKRIVMDAVEIPLLRNSYTRNLRPSASFDLAPTPVIVKHSLRRTRSHTEVQDDLNRSNKRRRSDWKSFDSEKETDSEGGDVFNIGEVPLPVLVPSVNCLSRNWYTLARQHPKRLVPSSELSSDDDPRLGQVTPHHLVSPELKRGKGNDLVDPPSDDSVMAPSPSRDLVERRLKRMESGSLVKITPFVLV